MMTGLLFSGIPRITNYHTDSGVIDYGSYMCAACAACAACACTHVCMYVCQV